jgi:hypothetical protein
MTFVLKVSFHMNSPKLPACSRASNAVQAILNEEVTVPEFIDLLTPLSAEMLQFVGTVLGCQSALSSGAPGRVRRARRFCLAAAANRRSNS